MIEPREPIEFNFAPAWSPVGLQWVTEEHEMRFRLESIDGGEIHGRIHAKHRGRDWSNRNLSIPTPATGAEFGRVIHDYDIAAEWTYVVEFRGNHNAEFAKLAQAVIHIAQRWDQHEEEFNELRMLKRLQGYRPAFPVPAWPHSDFTPSTKPEGYPVEELQPATIRYENGEWWATTRATSFAGFLVTPLQFQYIERKDKEHNAYQEWLSEVARQAHVIEKKKETPE